MPGLYILAGPEFHLQLTVLFNNVIKFFFNAVLKSAEYDEKAMCSQGVVYYDKNIITDRKSSHLIECF